MSASRKQEAKGLRVRTHGFNADYRDSYRKEPATDGWRRMVEWFATHALT